METINAALQKIKYRGEQKLTQYLLTEEDMTRTSTVNRFLTKLDIFSTTLGGDLYVTSSVLLPVIAAMKKMMQVDSYGSIYIARLKEVILNDFNRKIEINVDVNFFLLAAFLDPRWKDLKMISQQKRDKASDMIRREMLTLKQQISTAKDMGSKPPKKMMLVFDESDEEGDEDDAQDAELRRFETNFIFRILESTAVFLFCYHHLSGTETSPLWKETRILWAGGGAGRSSIRRW